VSFQEARQNPIIPNPPKFVLELGRAAAKKGLAITPILALFRAFAAFPTPKSPKSAKFAIKYFHYHMIKIFITLNLNFWIYFTLLSLFLSPLVEQL
jgi:hypothetical protein